MLIDKPTRFVLWKSTWDEEGEHPPEQFPNAQKVTIPYWDRRTCKTPEEFDECKIEKEPWLSKGEDHCLYDGGIARRVGTCEEYVVDITTLEELLELIVKHKYCDIRPHDSHQWTGLYNISFER